MNDPSVQLAVFGDVHGHLRLMFQLCRHWQLTHGVHLDGILQCGDLGFFPDLGTIDRATRRFSNRDPEELGFAYFFRLPEPAEQDPLLERTLMGDPADLNTVDCPVIFCHGNHADFQVLDRITCGAALASVDAFQRIHLLRSGEVTELAGVRIAALGGMPERDRPPERQVLSTIVSETAAGRLRRKQFDVLLSHGAPQGVGGPRGPWGSELAREVIELSQPAYNFFAHHRDAIPPGRIAGTECYWLDDVNFQKRDFKGPPRAGCMGVLTWTSPDRHQFTVIEEPWFEQVTGENWLDL